MQARLFGPHLMQECHFPRTLLTGKVLTRGDLSTRFLLFSAYIFQVNDINLQAGCDVVAPDELLGILDTSATSVKALHHECSLLSSELQRLQVQPSSGQSGPGWLWMSVCLALASIPPAVFLASKFA